MTLKGMHEWHKLPVSLAQLSIDTTLRCGQSFRWRKIDGSWTCALHGRVISLQQDTAELRYQVLWPKKSSSPPQHQASLPHNQGGVEADTAELLRHYFNLRIDLAELYNEWSSIDPNFKLKASTFAGVRILNQDAWEALIGFICSSNNNISRISQMVHKLCLYYGPFIAHVGDEPMHDFPSPEALTGKDVEAHLRQLGFGYRARYLAETARIVAQERPSNWLESLRNPADPSFGGERLPVTEYKTYKEAHTELLALSGVGPKVADCVCLFGLGWAESVPVDTHVWQIAQRDYKLGKTKTKTFNKAMYDLVGDHFRDLWGKHAGWAHSVLFTADLREFSSKTIKKEEEETLEIELKRETESPPADSMKRKSVLQAGIKLEEGNSSDEKGLRKSRRAATKRKRRRVNG